MKEFKEIIDGIAHSLNMSKDALVQAYPHLRTEYAWFGALGDTKWVFLFLGALALFAIFWNDLDFNYESDRKPLVLLITSVVFCAIMFAVLNVLQYVVAPDITLIKDIMYSIKNN